MVRMQVAAMELRLTVSTISVESSKIAPGSKQMHPLGFNGLPLASGNGCRLNQYFPCFIMNLELSPTSRYSISDPLNRYCQKQLDSMSGSSLSASEVGVVICGSSSVLVAKAC